MVGRTFVCLTDFSADWKLISRPTRSVHLNFLVHGGRYVVACYNSENTAS